MAAFLVVALPVISWSVFVAALLVRPPLNPVVFWWALFCLPSTAFLLELAFLHLASRPRRLLAYALVLLASALMPLVVTTRGVPFGLALFVFALVGWIPVALLSLRGSQPAFRQGRASPLLFGLLAAFQAMGFAAAF